MYQSLLNQLMKDQIILKIQNYQEIVNQNRLIMKNHYNKDIKCHNFLSNLILKFILIKILFHKKVK
jgi:hypothetical protein